MDPIETPSSPVSDEDSRALAEKASVFCSSCGSCSRPSPSWTKKRGSPGRRLGEQFNQQVPCQRKSECQQRWQRKGEGEVREQRKGDGQGWQRWRFFDGVSSCWKGWRKGVSTTSAPSSRCSPFQSLSPKKWIPAESYQTSVDYGSEVVEEKVHLQTVHKEKAAAVAQVEVATTRKVKGGSIQLSFSKGI